MVYTASNITYKNSSEIFGRPYFVCVGQFLWVCDFKKPVIADNLSNICTINHVKVIRCSEKRQYRSTVCKQVIQKQFNRPPEEDSLTNQMITNEIKWTKKGLLTILSENSLDQIRLLVFDL